MNLKRLFVPGQRLSAVVLERFLAENEFEQIDWHRMLAEVYRRGRWTQGPYTCRVFDDGKLIKQSNLAVGVHRTKGRIWGFLEK